MNNELRYQTVTQLSIMLQEKYVIPKIGKIFAAQINDKLSSGSYDDISDPYEFARIFTKDIQEVKIDNHLWIRYNQNKEENFTNSASQTKVKN